MSTTLNIVDAGRMAYRSALTMQEEFVARRQADEIEDSLILMEHDPVYTLGRNADESNVLLSANELAEREIDVVNIGRGGDVTFHGPGQLVGYPIIRLTPPTRGVLWFVEKLEDVLIATLADFGIVAERNQKNRGAWIGEDKIAAIGIRVTRQVTMHGFALNVSTDLNYYSGIVPCGLSDSGVVSMHVLNETVQMAQVKSSLTGHFKREFGYE